MTQRITGKFLTIQKNWGKVYANDSKDYIFEISNNKTDFET